MVEEGNRDMIWRHFDGVHPMDTYESTNTITVLEVSKSFPSLARCALSVFDEQTLIT
jgi:hypothetical protein